MSATYQAQNPFNQFAVPPAANQEPQYGQYPPQPPQQQYGQPAPQQQPPQAPQTPQQQHQLVVATQPSNPYAGMVAPQPPAQPPAPSYGAPMTSTAGSYDPFAAAPPPPPAPVSYAPVPAAPQDPWAAPAASQSFSAPPPQQQAYGPAPAPPVTDGYQVPTSFSNDDYGYASNRQMVPANGNNNNNASNYEDDNYDKNRELRNPYSNQLAQTVQGSNASGLPKAELVGKKGFVLSRISFRTIVMKKWKQSYWVQYGGHTMLWFRNEADFNDWLNNPYHTQMQRNFLIKLAINFVHDLYKPNVRGYQVTQCRTKPYGNNKVVRQFKLERWMDYGPTIAAAFGSYDPKEVDACREAIVECMKNTPLDNGIRATGAVKEHHERKQQEELRKSMEVKPQNGGSYNNYSVNGNGTNGVPEVDLLGDMGAGTDSASVPPGAYAPAPSGDFGALVPATNPNAAYPGAPPVPAAAPSQPSYYPSSPQRMSQQFAPAPPAAAPAYGAPAPQAYPGYSVQAPAAPAFAQPPAAQGGYPYQQQQQPPASGGYPPASYPVSPAQQF